MYLILYIIINFWQILKCHRSIYGYTLCLLDVQTCLWSDYKHHCMIKFLVCITANGQFHGFPQFIMGGAQTFILSDIQDSLIFWCPLTKSWQRFKIKTDLALKQCSLINPQSAAKDSQMVKKMFEIHQIFQMSRLKEPIRRLKEFKTLEHQQPLLYLPILNDIIQVISSLVNLKGPLTD